MGDMNIAEVMKNPEVQHAIKQFKRNPKNIMKMLQESMVFMAKFESFADTYLGKYDKNGNQLRKGDRDYIFDFLDEIIEKLKVVDEKLDQLLEKQDEIDKKLVEIHEKFDKR